MGLDFTELLSGVIEYFQNNEYIAMALAGVLLIFLYKKTKTFFVVLLIAAVIIGALFVISSTSDLGVFNKNKMVRTSIKDF
jgi:CHASE2 domain-containing sensor protein